MAMSETREGDSEDLEGSYSGFIFFTIYPHYRQTMETNKVQLGACERRRARCGTPGKPHTLPYQRPAISSRHLGSCAVVFSWVAN